MLLIADSGALAGLMTPAGRALSKPIEAYIAHAWLSVDGDHAGSVAAAARPGFAEPGATRRFTIGGLPSVVQTGKGAAALPAACRGARLVGTTATVRANARVRAGPCRLLDLRLLRRTGALAVWRQGGRLVFVAARSA